MRPDAASPAAVPATVIRAVEVYARTMWRITEEELLERLGEDADLALWA